MIEYAKVRDIDITEIDIKSQRERAGKSIRQMANLLDVDKAHYSRMERGIIAMPKVRYEEFVKIIEKL